MTMILREATYVASNGTEFTFKYAEEHREIRVYLGARLHMTIGGVLPENSAKEMNRFMEIWNDANPS